MSEDNKSGDTKRDGEIANLQNDLKTSGLSRRNFLDRLKALGIGFGAAGAIGADAQARESMDKAVTLSSTNPALDGIITEGREDAKAADPDRVQTAQYFRGYRRFYRRGYRRFFYRRFYRRGYRRFFYRRFF